MACHNIYLLLVWPCHNLLLIFFIPSGSGQAVATLPVMLPLGESLGLSKQITILAFQIGDGLTNLVNPIGRTYSYVKYGTYLLIDGLDLFSLYY